MSSAITAAAVVAVGGAAAGKMQSDAANKAAREQRKATSKAIKQQMTEFDKMNELLAPYVQAGNTAMAEQMRLLGLGSSDTFTGTNRMSYFAGKFGEGGPTLEEAQQREQSRAIQEIAANPELQAMMEQGEEAIMRNAAVTGGIRGGNVQGALAQYRPAMLQQAIDRRMSQLGNISQLGQASAAGVGSAGIQTGTNISNLQQQAGANRAGLALAEAQAQGQMWAGLGQAAGMGIGAYANRQQTQTPSYDYQPNAQTIGTYQGQPIRVW